MSERLEFVRLARTDGANKSELCRRFGISRKTGHKWLCRYQEEGTEGLADRSRRPRNSPGKTSSEIEHAVLKVRIEHPSWSGRKIRRVLLNQGFLDVPAASTITSILRRHGMIDAAESEKHKSFTRFERPEPNDLWQLDFKGEFKLSNGKWCFPLTILDDCSRYSLGVKACGNQRGETVKRHLRSVFETYGIPLAIYVDNGNPWGTAHPDARHTRFSLWLMRRDIEVIHGRPYHPQGRGKLERFHRTLKRELLQERQFRSLKESQLNFDPWRTTYNHQRPHEALSLDVPAERYRPSERSFKETKGLYEYSSHFQTRRPNNGGQFQFEGEIYRITEKFNDQAIGLAPTQIDGIWDVYYCRFRIGQINQHTRKFSQSSGTDESRSARSIRTTGENETNR